MPGISSPPIARARALLVASVVFFALPSTGLAQTGAQLPSVTVDPPQQQRQTATRVSQGRERATRVARARKPPPVQPTPGERGQSGAALAVLGVQQALKEINQTPGGVALVPAEAYRNSTVANTIKDIVDYTPGVWAQPKWGDDTRLSIRGSGLSRNFHLRGVQLYMDGIPINTADGYGDFQEIDPTAYRYVEIYRRQCAAIRRKFARRRDQLRHAERARRQASARVDAGQLQLHARTGQTAARRAFDYFVTASVQHQDGFREHSSGQAMRGNANFGYRFSPNAETRFYINANEVRQRIPRRGNQDKRAHIAADRRRPNNLLNDWQRNIDTVRVANKTTAVRQPRSISALSLSTAT